MGTWVAFVYIMFSVLPSFYWWWIFEQVLYEVLGEEWGAVLLRLWLLK